MAKGLEKHQARRTALSRFGKDLTRRSVAKCELCGSGGVSLRVFEIPPEALEPDYEDCLFLCEECSSQLAKPKTIRPDHWRSLVSVIWSEVPAVQVMAACVLDRLSRDHEWAREALEEVYLDEEIEKRVKAVAL